MPMYEYHCEKCGHEEEVLQKFSDDPLTDCPQCGSKNSLHKKIFAAGFQLKGTGWYETDFKDKKPAHKSTSAAPVESKPAETETKTEKKAETKNDDK